MDEREIYYTNKLYLDWDYHDNLEYRKHLDDDGLPEFIILDEKEEGYTYHELRDIVEKEEEKYDYYVEYWCSE
tara:strand:+ start:54 stop:272 length:219 start_codon:yes stop_codon:yes gene_type:complete